MSGRAMMDDTKQCATKECKTCGRVLPIDRFSMYNITKQLASGEKTYTYQKISCRQCSTKRSSVSYHKRLRRKHDERNRIDIAMSTEEGFDGLLKEFGL